MDKVFVITQSLRCRRCGWASLIPLLGLPFAVAAFRAWRHVHVEAGNEWNPARRELVWGSVLAIVGTVTSLAVIAVVEGSILYGLFDSTR